MNNIYTNSMFMDEKYYFNRKRAAIYTEWEQYASPELALSKSYLYNGNRKKIKNTLANILFIPCIFINFKRIQRL